VVVKVDVALTVVVVSDIVAVAASVVNVGPTVEDVSGVFVVAKFVVVSSTAVVVSDIVVVAASVVDVGGTVDDV